QTLGSLYTLTINGVRDQAAASNSIAANSEVTFVSLDYVVTNIGNSAVAGTLTPAGGGYDFLGAGAGVGGTSDQFTYAYRLVNGDFDVQLRLGSLAFSNAWARAGLMARESFATNATYAASFATPDLAGCFFSA